MLILGIGSLVLVIILLTFVGKVVKTRTQKEQSIMDRQSKISNYQPTQKFYINNKVISIDENSHKLAISDEQNDYVIDFSDIIESEIVENESSITKTSRSSQLGGALVGGVLAGGVGAVVGGLSGSKRSETAVNRISLKIVVNNLQHPNHSIDFLNSKDCIKI